MVIARLGHCLRAGILILALSATAPPRAHHRRPMIVPPVSLDINSAAFQEAMARNQSIGLRKASRTKRNVVRVFIVGWEMHHGYDLVPFDRHDDWVMPDFLDQEVSAAFDAQNRQDVYAAHVGERLLCDCTGVTWHFYTSERFIVRSAKLRWVK